MKLFPAIDLRDGQVVRLLQGDYNRMSVYGDDPCAFARRFLEDGADCLHVVDLDGAKDGTTANFGTVAALAQTKGLFLEIGGGIRTEERICRYLDMGAGRVILGTVAVQDAAFTAAMAKKYGAGIAVGVDARDGFVATHGWLKTSTLEGVAFCRQLRDAGVQTVIYTDISRDGTLGGTNLEVYRQLVEIDGLHIVASGGVTALEELAALRDMGVSAAILGKALYTGRIDLRQAVNVARGDGAC